MIVSDAELCFHFQSRKTNSLFQERHYYRYIQVFFLAYFSRYNCPIALARSLWNGGNVGISAFHHA